MLLSYPTGRALLVAFVLALGAGGRLWAQGVGAAAAPEPPPGGWPVRVVTEMRRVAEPPGGLVPYRQGTRWGMADTTGRLWIRPTFAQQPAFAVNGLLRVTHAWKVKRERHGRNWQRRAERDFSLICADGRPADFRGLAARPRSRWFLIPATAARQVSEWMARRAGI